MTLCDVHRRIAVLLIVIASLQGCAAAAPETHPSRGAGEWISDAFITATVKIALGIQSGVKATEIEVDTDRGTVTLHGEVGSEAERQLAVKVAEDVDGVKGVINQIQVRG